MRAGAGKMLHFQRLQGELVALQKTVATFCKDVNVRASHLKQC